MIKTEIKMRVTPEQSKKVQEICFSSGIKWGYNKYNITHIDVPYLFINENKTLTYTQNYKNFKDDLKQEIDPDLFIRTNGNCTYDEVIKNKFMKLIDKRNKANKKLREFARKYGLEELI